MRLAAAVSLLLASLSLTAQPLHVGDAVPLTNTRYAAVSGVPLLRSNGTDQFLFFVRNGAVHVTRLVEGQKRVGQHVVTGTNPAVFWTGSHFLVLVNQMSAGSRPIVVARIVGPTGEPEGRPFIVAGNEMLSAGFDGENVLLVTRSSTGDHYTTRMLRPDGHRVDIASDRVLAEGPRALVSNGDGFVGIATDADGTTILRFDDDGALLWAKTLIARGRVASIATSGSDFLAIWSDGQTYIDGVRVRADGTVEQEFSIGSEAGGFINVPAVAWSNDHYTVSYVSGFNEDATTGLLRILRVDAVSRSVVQNEIRSVDPACGTTLARFGDRTIGAWCEQPDGTPAIVMRDVATHDPATEIAFGATDQPLARGTSSADATLVVWREVEDHQVALRAGLRQRDGMWSEKQIAADASPQLVASDGNQFLVVTRNDKTPAFSAIVLSAGLGVIARVATLPFEPLAVAPNGRGYAIVGIDNHDLYGVEVSTSGIMSAPLLLREHPQNGSVVHAALAFDGTNLFAVWQVSVAAFAGSIHSTLEAARLTPSLARMNAQDAILADDAENPAVAWDGSASRSRGSLPMTCCTWRDTRRRA